jgi:hypothetical protein
VYFPDLSLYTYLHAEPLTLNIGWLDAQHSFPIGESSPHFIDRLRTLMLTPTNQTRGFHRCPFCSDPLARSSAEIRVAGRRGITYAAPMLILHYVEAHNYLPPREFVAAVVSGNNWTLCGWIMRKAKRALKRKDTWARAGRRARPGDPPRILLSKAIRNGPCGGAPVGRAL